MTYILIKTVDNLPDGVEHLLVQGRNKLYRPTSPALHEVTTLVYGYKVQLQKNLVLMVRKRPASFGGSGGQLGSPVELVKPGCPALSEHRLTVEVKISVLSWG
jgi:hypothetical protein